MGDSTEQTSPAAASETDVLAALAGASSDVSVNGQKVTSLGAPAADTDAATKAYVDAVAVGLMQPKASVRAATTANITLSGAQTIDGVSVIAGDRVLVKNQSTGSQNGIYVCAAGAWSRSTDADASAEVKAGLYCFVEEGSTNADSGWVLSTNNPITLGSTSLTFVKFSSIGGDFVGPASSTDNAIVRFDGTGGKTGQSSLVTVSDSDMVDIPNTSGAGLRIHNTADTATNYEALIANVVSNVFTISTASGGTGTQLRNLLLRGGTGGGQITLSASGSLAYGAVGGTVPTYHSATWPTATSTSAVQVGFSVSGTVNQTSGTGGMTALLVNPTLTAVGSAGANLLRLQAGSSDKLRVDSSGKVTQDATNTAGGTTGNQTINKPTGTVNFAAAATSLTVTNSLCSTSSIVFAVVRTNDATAYVKNVVPGSGSFVITLGAAATAETSVGFEVKN